MARYVSNAVLVLVTALAISVMWWLSMRTDQRDLARDSAFQVSHSPLEAYQPTVSIGQFSPEVCELYQTFSGKIRPWETYSLSFEVGGRVVDLGKGEQGVPLDVGDRVAEGQILAQLDDRVFRARVSEATARLELATSDMERARNLRSTEAGAISITEFQQRLTNLALATAQRDMAVKNFEDTVLKSPVDGTIAWRRVNEGESVRADRESFQVIEDDPMLLVVHVPESQVRELEVRLREVRAAQGRGDDAPVDPEDRVFRAHVRLEGSDRFGRPWPTIDGEVHQIAEVADPRTGLFEVEIRLDNRDHLLRGGMVATARLVTKRLSGYRLPDSAVVFRGGDAFLFLAEPEQVDVEAMFWKVGTTTSHRARRLTVSDWTEQGNDLIIPSDSKELWRVVLRGQRRLSDGQWVEVVDSRPPTSAAQRPAVAPASRFTAREPRQGSYENQQ